MSLSSYNASEFFFRLCLFALSQMCHVVAAGQCPAQEPIYWKALKGYTFKTLLGSSPFGCLYHCHYEVRCQSYNFVLEDKICEMNNRTKEAKPKQFVSDPDRFYMKRGKHRGKIYLTLTLNICIAFMYSRSQGKSREFLNEEKLPWRRRRERHKTIGFYAKNKGPVRAL